MATKSGRAKGPPAVGLTMKTLIWRLVCTSGLAHDHVAREGASAREVQGAGEWKVRPAMLVFILRHAWAVMWGVLYSPLGSRSHSAQKRATTQKNNQKNRNHVFIKGTLPAADI